MCRIKTLFFLYIILKNESYNELRFVVQIVNFFLQFLIILRANRLNSFSKFHYNKKNFKCHFSPVALYPLCNFVASFHINSHYECFKGPFLHCRNFNFNSLSSNDFMLRYAVGISYKKLSLFSHERNIMKKDSIIWQKERTFIKIANGSHSLVMIILP